jgi:hypothetical protein
MNPLFGVAFDPTRNVVARIVYVDQNQSDSEEGVKASLRQHCPPGHEMIFIPEHQAPQMESILDGLGVRMTEEPRAAKAPITPNALPVQNRASRGCTQAP